MSKTNLWIGSIVVLMGLGYLLTSLGQVDYVRYIFTAFGIILSVFLFIEAGVIQYFKKENYKQIGFGDIVVFGTIIVATGVLLNSILVFQAVRDVMPSWLASFATTTGVLFGVLGIIAGVLHITFPRFK